MGKLTPNKARRMLKEGRANGKELTTKQKKYFGGVAGGSIDPDRPPRARTKTIRKKSHKTRKLGKRKSTRKSRRY